MDAHSGPRSSVIQPGSGSVLSIEKNNCQLLYQTMRAVTSPENVKAAGAGGQIDRYGWAALALIRAPIDGSCAY